MNNPWIEYLDWLIEKSLDLEMKGGNRGNLNYLKGFGLMMLGGVCPAVALIIAFAYLLSALGLAK